MEFFKIKRIDTESEACEFQTKFSSLISYDIPHTYFLEGNCYGLYVKGELVGGYCVVSSPLYNLRSVRQVPQAQLDMVPEFLKENLAEFTGYFLENKLYAFFLTIHLVWFILTCKDNKFIYSYPSSQTRLKEYYAKGNPVRIYVGSPKKLMGHNDDMEPESVEILSRYGIVKIFLHRTWKYLKKAILPQRNDDG